MCAERFKVSGCHDWRAGLVSFAGQDTRPRLKKVVKISSFWFGVCQRWHRHRWCGVQQPHSVSCG